MHRETSACSFGSGEANTTDIQETIMDNNMQRLNRVETIVPVASEMTDESFSENSTLEGSAYLSMAASDRSNGSSLVASEAHRSRHSTMSTSNDGSALSSVSELTPNSQHRITMRVPLQSSIVRRSNSGGGSGNSGADVPPSRPRQRLSHTKSMPSLANFEAFPLEDLKEDFDDSNSCFEMNDSHSSRLHYQQDESGEDRNNTMEAMPDQSDDLDASHSESVVTMSGKQLLERKQLREESKLFRRKSHRDVIDESTTNTSSSSPQASLLPPTKPMRRPPSPPPANHHNSSDDHSVDYYGGPTIVNDGQSVVSGMTYDDESTITSFTPSTGSSSFWGNKHQETATFAQHNNCRPPQRSKSSSLRSPHSQTLTPTAKSNDEDDESLSPLQQAGFKEESQRAFESAHMSLPAHNHFLSLPIREEDENDNTSQDTEKVSLSGKKMLAKQQRKQQPPPATRHQSYQQYAQYKDIFPPTSPSSRRNLLQKAHSVSHISSLEHRLMALPKRNSSNKEESDIDALARNQPGPAPVVNGQTQAPQMPVRSGESISIEDTVGCTPTKARNQTRSLSPNDRSSRWITGCRDEHGNEVDVDQPLGETSGWQVFAESDGKQMVFQRDPPASDNIGNNNMDRGLGAAPRYRRDDDSIISGPKIRRVMGLSRSMSTPNFVVDTADAKTNAETLHPQNVNSMVSFLLGEGIQKSANAPAGQSEPGANGKSDEKASKAETKKEASDHSKFGDTSLQPINSVSEMPETKPPQLLPTVSQDSGELKRGWQHADTSLVTPPTARERLVVSMPALDECPTDLGSPVEEGQEPKGIMKKLKKQMKASSRYLRKKTNSSYASAEKDELAKLSKSMSSFEIEDSPSAGGAFHMGRLEELPEEEVADSFDTIEVKPTSINPKKKKYAIDDTASSLDNKQRRRSTAAKTRVRGKHFSMMRAASVPNLSSDKKSSRRAKQLPLGDTIIEEEEASVEREPQDKQSAQQASPHPESGDSASPKRPPVKRRTRNTKIPSVRDLDAGEHSNSRPPPRLLAPTKDTAPVQFESGAPSDRTSQTPVRDKSRGTRTSGKEKRSKSTPRREKKGRSKSASARPRRDKVRSKMSASVKSSRTTYDSSMSSLSMRRNNESTSSRSEDPFFSLASTLKEENKKARREGRPSYRKHQSLRNMEDSSRRNNESSQSFLTQQIRRMPKADPLSSSEVHRRRDEAPATPSTSSRRSSRMRVARMAQSERFLGRTKPGKMLGGSVSSEEEDDRSEEKVRAKSKPIRRSLSRSSRTASRRNLKSKPKKQPSSRDVILTVSDESAEDGSGALGNQRQGRKLSTSCRTKPGRSSKLEKAQSLRHFGY